VTISVDRRIGSAELLPLFKRYKAPTKIVTLPAADFAFTGQGPDGEVSVGVERKTIGDFCQSFTSGRFTSHQLPLLHKHYDYVFLIVEGMARREDQDGTIVVWSGASGWRPQAGLTWTSFQGVLTTLQLRAGVFVRETINNGETAGLVAGLWRWFSRDWSAHESHLGPARPYLKSKDAWMVHQPTQEEKIAFQLPGLGPKLSRYVTRFFANSREMVNADASDWEAIPGVGKVTARNIVHALTHKLKRGAQ
jgi:ERCC4-type nuclease